MAMVMPASDLSVLNNLMFREPTLVTPWARQADSNQMAGLARTCVP